MASTDQTTKPISRRAKVGMVRSISGDKTISVILNTVVKHPRYGKYIRRRTNLAVHCPGNDASVGDLVEIVPCRRLSKSKSWRMVKVVRREHVD